MINASGSDEFSVQFLAWMNAELRRHIEETEVDNTPGLLRRAAGVLAAGTTAVIAWIVNLADF